MLIAVAAMASVSCQKEGNAPVNESKSATITLQANVVDTKTYIENNAILWGDGEYVQLYFNDGADKYAKSTSQSADWSGDTQAKFSFDITYDEAESYVLGGVYPASAATSNDNKTAATKYKVELPATQNPTASSYDPAAFIMIMKPETVESFDKDAHLASFRRAVALNKITLKGLQETITSVEFEVAEDKYLAGRRYFDLTTGVEGEIYYAQSNKITVNSTYNKGDVDVWFTSWGVELAEGDNLTIKMSSATKTYTKTITARESGIKFVEGGLNKLTVDMSSVAGVVTDSYAGEYLIVNTDMTRAAQAWNSGNNLPEYTLTAEDGVIIESDGLANCKMTIELQENGKYTIRDAKGQYLYAPSSSSNHLNGKTTPDESTDWTIAKDSEVYVLTSSGNNSRNILRYNSSAKVFSCYSSGQGDVTLYKYSDVKADNAPKIVVTETEKSIGADGGELIFTYTLKNLDGQDVTVTETSDFLSATASNGTVTVTVDANEGEEREAVITLSCGEAAAVELTVSQAAAVTDEPDQPGESGAYYVKVTSAPADWTGEYLIVYEDGNVAFDGSLTSLDATSNTKSVSISDSKIMATKDMKAIEFTIDASSHVKSASGYYIGQTSNANGLKSSTSTQYTNTISINSDGSVNLVSGGAYLRYNATSGQNRFRYFKSSTYTNQKAIHLYKLN